QCTEVAAALYGSVLDNDAYRVSSPAVAEMEKILENTFRNINIALANEMAILCNKMNLDVWEVIDAAATKPYGFMPFYPGPGLGGHCIPIDPWYLTWKAREYSYHTRLIETAGEINNDIPDNVITRMLELAGAEWTSVDPHVESFEYLNETIYPQDQVTQELLNSADIILIGTNHASFDYELILESETPVFDTRNSYSKKVENSKYYKL